MVATRSGDKGSAATAAGEKHDIKRKPASSSKRAKTNSGEKKDAGSKKGLENEDTNEDVPMKNEGDDEAGSEHDNEPESKTTAENKDEPGAVEPGARGDIVPASILEKGIIYVFMKGKVGIDEPTSLDEVKRTYILLRPIAKDAKLNKGPIGDVGNTRLIAIPKKVIPQSGRDRWIAFVEKVDASFKTLQNEFIASKDYETKTSGMRHNPAADPVGEGVYCITSTGRETHLAYLLAHMHMRKGSEFAEVQAALGLKMKGSLIISTRNPSYEAPVNARFPKGPDFPEEVKKEFRGLRWIPTQPKHLDYANTQFLMIGETSGIEKATEPQEEDQKAGKEEPLEELEKLEDEDNARMQCLGDDDAKAIFADLQINVDDYPDHPTFKR
jgi:hypothetical protein